jgi:8-oxo-dGTP pyrophosphatase MutT (NUDIX family)
VPFGHGNYVGVVLHVGGSKASDVKLVLQRESRSGKIWFTAGSIVPNEEPFDAAVRELFEGTSLTLIVNDLTLLRNNHVRIPLLAGKHELVHVFVASVLVPFVNSGTGWRLSLRG